MAKLPTVAPFTRRLVLCGAGVVLQPDAPRSVYYQGSQQLSPESGEETANLDSSGEKSNFVIC